MQKLEKKEPQLDVMDRNRRTPLILAAMEGHSEVVKYLLKLSADVTLKGTAGMTALHMAAKNGHWMVCQVILTECIVSEIIGKKFL